MALHLQMAISQKKKLAAGTKLCWGWGHAPGLGVRRAQASTYLSTRSFDWDQCMFRAEPGLPAPAHGIKVDSKRWRQSFGAPLGHRPFSQHRHPISSLGVRQISVPGGAPLVAAKPGFGQNRAPPGLSLSCTLLRLRSVLIPGEARPPVLRFRGPDEDALWPRKLAPNPVGSDEIALRALKLLARGMRPGGRGPTLRPGGRK